MLLSISFTASINTMPSRTPEAEAFWAETTAGPALLLLQGSTYTGEQTFQERHSSI